MSPPASAHSHAARDLGRLRVLVATALDEEGAETKLDHARAPAARHGAAEAALDATESPDFVDEPAASSSLALDAA